MEEIEGKWDGVEESDKPKMVKGVNRLGKNLDALGRLKEALNSPKRQLRAGRQVATYLMGDASGFGFGSVMWGQGRISSESGDFYPLYQVRLSNFREGDNLTTGIKQSVASGELQDVELFIFKENMVFENMYYKETSKISLLFEIVLQLNQF